MRAAAVGALTVAQLEQVAAHLESCPTCEARLAHFDGHTDELISGLRGQPPAAAASASNWVRKFVAWVHETVSDRRAATIVNQAASVGPPAFPSQIGRFEIRSLLGQGAFGAVYKAFDPQLNRDVAIKSPREGMVQTSEERDAFLREARVVATINHPNVSQIYEVGQHDGRPYLVMALVNGSSLAETLQNRAEPFTGPQAAMIVRTVALALEVAHAKGIVHRDIKPGNLMFDRDRKDVVVMDFGLARGPQLSDVAGTQTGVIKGTPAYMSPEQARGDAKAVGPTSDVFSLGVVFYELLAGVRPFTGASPIDMIASILRDDPPPPSAKRASVDPRLEAICLQALAKEPSQRQASMKELAAAIDRALRSMAKAPRRPASPARVPSSREIEPPSPAPGLSNVRLPPRVAAPTVHQPSAAAPFPPSPPSVNAVIAVLDRRGSTQYPGLFPTAGAELDARPQTSPERGLRGLVVGLGVAGLCFLLLASLATPSRMSDRPITPASQTSEAGVPPGPDRVARVPSKTKDKLGLSPAPEATAPAPLDSLPSTAAPLDAPHATPPSTEPLDDDLRELLDEAKREFAQRIVEYKTSVAALLDEREAAARQAADDRRANEIQAERTAFETTGKLPTTAPEIRSRLLHALRDVSAAYARAVEEYTRRRLGDLATAAAKELLVLKAQAGFPSIAGLWSEGVGLRVLVTQHGDRFTAAATYQHPSRGEIRWQMTGVVSNDGEIKAHLEHTQAPLGWSNQVRVGTYSASDGVIRGRYQSFDERNTFEWKLIKANLESTPVLDADLHVSQLATIIGSRAGEGREFTDIKIPFRWCPRGRFRMGSPMSDAQSEPDEKPQVEVTLSRGFWLGETEVTQGVWTNVTGTEPFARKKYTKVGGDFPASFVSWHDATLFCELLTLRETLAGRIPNGSVYRLPTEAEWEYACRAGTTTLYSCGNDPGQLGSSAWYNANAWNRGMMHALQVGRKEPNRWGLRDMHGNVLEWCRDVYADKLSGGLDPQGPSDGTGRVLRGGRVYHPAARLRSANREPDFAEHRYDGNGFRVLLAPSGE